MNKDTINIDGKTYVRQDNPTVDPAEIKRAEKLCLRYRRMSSLLALITATILGYLFNDIIFWFISLLPLKMLYGMLIYFFKIRHMISEEVLDAMPTHQRSSNDDWRTNPIRSYMPGNIYHRY